MEKELDSKIVSAFERIAEVIKNLRITYGKKFGISPIQIQILFYLYEKKSDSTTLTELAEYFQLSKPTISDSLYNLAKKGYIRKKQNQKDRRNEFIILTKEGIKISKKIRNYLIPLEESLSIISMNEKESLFGHLTAIIHFLYNSGHIKMQKMCYLCKYFQRSEIDNQFFCTLLRKPLKIIDIRINCPDFDKIEAK